MNKKFDFQMRQVLHNLSLMENNNRNITEHQISEYRGMILSSMAGILGTYPQFYWHSALNKLDDLLPENHIDLRLVFPEGWQSDLDENGNIIRLED